MLLDLLKKVPHLTPVRKHIMGEDRPIPIQVNADGLLREVHATEEGLEAGVGAEGDKPRVYYWQTAHITESHDTQTSLEPPSHGALVAQVFLSELVFQVPFLANDHAVVHDNDRRDEQPQNPYTVCRYTDANAKESQHQVGRVAGESKGTSGDYGSRWLARIKIRPSFAKLEKDKRNYESAHGHHREADQVLNPIRQQRKRKEEIEYNPHRQERNVNQWWDSDNLGCVSFAGVHRPFSLSPAATDLGQRS